ncbi:hypothetical protein [Aeromicrobium sp.]|uniref:hypothetical protein n=1 Tax=Aeromicrobium sp. TaxID=1871063 RepID=UPI0019A054A0|nr:hypothetical protein [Aeromicrobium sp.]MBC7632209.1 hypothetical protein [Aeromicrobium sp.]
MRTTRRRASLVAAVSAVLALGTITAASAYWAGSGGGSGSAATGTARAVTLSSATASAQLQPGGQAAVELSITNPNPGSVRVTSLALDTTQGIGGFTVDSSHSACVLTTLSFSTQTNNSSGWTVPGAGSLPVTLANSLSMSTSAGSACQGASFTVFLKAGP